MTGKTVAQLVVEAALPGIGGPIYSSFELLYQLCGDMRDGEANCRDVAERIELLYNKLKDIQDANQLEESRVLPELAVTIKDFQTFMEMHAKKHTLARFFARHDVDAKIIGFHRRINALFQVLNLEHAASLDTWTKRVEQESQARHVEMIAEIRNNKHAILMEYRGNTLREAMLMLKFAIASSATKNSHQFSREDIAAMKETLEMMVVHSDVPVQELPSWYLPFEDVVCEEEEFDKGTYGTVHRGKWDGATVVVKRLLVRGAEVEKNFLSEATIWHSLDHPHVIKLFGACHASSPLFFVCEVATHGNFAQFFGKSEASKKQLWRRFHEAALGLKHLHSRKVVHGDLKCNNLLVGADGTTKICDFGFSYIRAESKSFSDKAKADAVRWSALECLDTAAPVFASDVYSLGMCIIEAVSGDLPWGDMTDDDIVEMLYDGNSHARPDGLSNEQWGLVETMVAIKKEDRVPLNEVVQLLEGFKIEEEERERLAEEELQRLSAVVQVCPECCVASPGSANFCSGCAYRFAAP